jgi:flavin reductase (DIM6/NTAB) family NADH-FMN oxidoreductase RutF
MKQVSFKEAMDLWAKPERVVLITSMDHAGHPHVMTVGWKMRTSFHPPMLAIAISKERSMQKCISESKEFVMAVPGEDLAKEVLLCGTTAKEKIDRFKECQFITKPGNYISSPLIENCLANFECKLVTQLSTGDHSIFVGEVLASWISEKSGKNLIVIGEEEGYKFLAEQGPYRIGIIRP